MDIVLLQLVDVRQIVTEDILCPENRPHAAFPGRRDNSGDSVHSRIIGSASVFGFQGRILVVLRMRSGEITAVKVEIVLLLAVVR